MIYRDQHVQPISEGDLWLLAQAASAVAGFVARNRGALEKDQPCASRIEIPGPAGKVTVEVSYAPPAGEPPYVLEDLLWRTLDVAGAKNELQRLQWSFFRAPGPKYAANQPEAAGATMRFLDWAVFAACPGEQTIAQRASGRVRDLFVTDVDPEALLEPRISCFDVLQIGQVELLVRDRLAGDELRVRPRPALRRIEPDEVILGGVHPTGHGDYLMGLGALTIPRETAASLPSFEDVDPSTLAALLEQNFGANTEWIEDLSLVELNELYREVRKAIEATGDELPTFRVLQKRIAAADSPTTAVRSLLAHAVPWGEGEMAVLAAILLRAWNLTPRRELGGRTPESMALD